MTDLEHADKLMNAKKGQWLMASAQCKVQHMPAGNVFNVEPGTKFRVKFGGGGLWGELENAQTVVINKEDLPLWDIVK